MLRAMVFIDFENFEIAKYSYYKKKCLEDAQNQARIEGKPEPSAAPINMPKLDFNAIPREVVSLLPQTHELVKTFLFAPKPDDFLMKDSRRASTYNWINGLKNQDFFTVIEGVHSARPVSGYTYATMSLDVPGSYYVEEKGTDVNLAAHIINKGLHNSYDTAVIMSGDTDYIPVMDIMNGVGKSIVVVGVKWQNLFQFKHHSDAQITIDDLFFQRCLRP
jgi:uncharacterized LabA/DUF88 family protein